MAGGGRKKKKKKKQTKRLVGFAPSPRSLGHVHVPGCVALFLRTEFISNINIVLQSNLRKEGRKSATHPGTCPSERGEGAKPTKRFVCFFFFFVRHPPSNCLTVQLQGPVVTCSLRLQGPNSSCSIYSKSRDLICSYVNSKFGTTHS
jgi:hypothetical protein